MNYYDLLGIDPQSSFDTLKKAYYRKAKTCHPDLFGNSPQKKQEFQLLVEAFNILSNAEKRRCYNQTLQVKNSVVEQAVTVEPTIMDSDVDDTLEELIVGNDIPENATLLTLFLDLERTQVFMTWREAKYFYSIKRYRTAQQIFTRLVRMTPTNILYRVFLARCHVHLKHWSRAKYHYRTALELGKRRRPPQRLIRVRKELENAEKKHHPLLYKIKQFFCPTEIKEYLTPDEQAIRETNRSIARILREQALEEKFSASQEQNKKLLK